MWDSKDAVLKATRQALGSKIHPSKVPTLGDEDKSVRAWLPKADNELSVRGKIPHSNNNINLSKVKNNVTVL